MTALAAIHVGKRELGLDDDTYRALLKRVTGKQSSKGMSDGERRSVLEEMRRLGFKGGSNASSNGVRTRLEGPYARKLQALWIALYNLGVIDNQDDAALLAFAKRQCGIERTEWIRDPHDATKVIEALKAMAERAGVVWTVSRRTPQVAKRHGYQIAQAQWNILTRSSISSAFWDSVSGILGRSVAPERPPSDAEWQKVMNDFGKRIRGRPDARKASA